jgi:hypothetical protein
MESVGTRHHDGGSKKKRTVHEIQRHGEKNEQKGYEKTGRF